jgi:hypothetical protein
VAGNIAADFAPDFNGTAQGSFNLIGDGSRLMELGNGSDGNQVGTAHNPINSLLAPLDNYGGPAQTLALLPASPVPKAANARLAISAGIGRHRDTAISWRK